MKISTLRYFVKNYFTKPAQKAICASRQIFGIISLILTFKIKIKIGKTL